MPTLGRTEFMRDEKPVDIETVAKDYAPTSYGKKMLLRKLSYEYAVPIMNERYPVIAGVTYQIRKKNDELVLKPF